MSNIIYVLGGVIAGGLIGYMIRQNLASRKIGTAESRAEKILEEAKTKEKEIVIEAKAQALEITDQAKKTEADFRNQIIRFEERIDRKEKELDQKEKNIENDLKCDVNENLNTEKQKNILTLGDSLTAGYGVDISENYPTKLEKKLLENNFIEISFDNIKLDYLCKMSDSHNCQTGSLLPTSLNPYCKTIHCHC